MLTVAPEACAVLASLLKYVTKRLAAEIKKLKEKVSFVILSSCFKKG